MSRSGSEADSLIDLYQRQNSDTNLRSEDHDIPENMYRPEDDDPEGWIHRDKLAKIESEELQAAGINLANARKNNRSVKRLPNRSEQRVEEDYSKTTHDDKRQRVASPMTVDEDAEQQNWDLRTPEEIAADPTPVSSPLSNPVVRRAGSKIPILTSSPLPIPTERIERDTPLPRKRTMSGSLSLEDVGATPRSRPRKSSAGSQILLDEMDGKEGRTNDKTSSPTKLRTQNSLATPSPALVTARKTTPTTRKGSATAKATTPGSPSQRPGTRSGETDRPRTAVNRPEGDPPWLATMYKPDPRLPPDQQIIPTHARKQQQAQWHQEGAIPDTYGRDFTPLSVRPPEETPPPKQLAAATTLTERSDENANAWPLKSMASIRSASSGRPGTSGSITGGYSTMPRVTSPPIGVHSPKLGQSPRVSQLPGQQRMQEQKLETVDKDDGKVEKGCGCCIVM